MQAPYLSEPDVREQFTGIGRGWESFDVANRDELEHVDIWKKDPHTGQQVTVLLRPFQTQPFRLDIGRVLFIFSFR